VYSYSGHPHSPDVFYCNQNHIIMKSLLIYCVFLAYPTTILQAQNIPLTQADSLTIFNHDNDSLMGTIFYADTFNYVFADINGEMYTWQGDIKYYFKRDERGCPLNMGDAIRLYNIN